MSLLYVSSTFSDLVEERESVYRALRQAGYDVRAMEDYVASDERPLERCLADVAASDVYIGIIAWRYGYVPSQGNPERMSITGLEYRHALQLGKPTLLFLLDPSAPWPKDRMETGEGSARLEQLRSELAADKLVSYFSTADELARLVVTAVVRTDTSTGAVDDPDQQLLSGPLRRLLLNLNNETVERLLESSRSIAYLLMFDMRTGQLPRVVDSLADPHSREGLKRVGIATEVEGQPKYRFQQYTRFARIGIIPRPWTFLQFAEAFQRDLSLLLESERSPFSDVRDGLTGIEVILHRFDMQQHYAFKSPLARDGAVAALKEVLSAALETDEVAEGLAYEGLRGEKLLDALAGAPITMLIGEELELTPDEHDALDAGDSDMRRTALARLGLRTERELAQRLTSDSAPRVRQLLNDLLEGVLLRTLAEADQAAVARADAISRAYVSVLVAIGRLY